MKKIKEELCPLTSRPWCELNFIKVLKILQTFVILSSYTDTRSGDPLKNRRRRAAWVRKRLARLPDLKKNTRKLPAPVQTKFTVKLNNLDENLSRIRRFPLNTVERDQRIVPQPFDISTCAYTQRSNLISTTRRTAVVDIESGVRPTLMELRGSVPKLSSC